MNNGSNEGEEGGKTGFDQSCGEGVKRTGRGLGFLNEVRNFSRSGQ